MEAAVLGKGIEIYLLKLRKLQGTHNARVLNTQSESKYPRITQSCKI